MLKRKLGEKFQKMSDEEMQEFFEIERKKKEIQDKLN